MRVEERKKAYELSMRMRFNNAREQIVGIVDKTIAHSMAKAKDLPLEDMVAVYDIYASFLESRGINLDKEYEAESFKSWLREIRKKGE